MFFIILKVLLLKQIKQFFGRLESDFKKNGIIQVECIKFAEAAVQRCSVKGVLRNFVKFTRKHQRQSLFLIKLQASVCTLLKRDSGTGVFMLIL